MISCRPRLRHVAAAAALAFALDAGAAVDVLGADASALPGGLAAPSVAFAFSSPYQLLSLDLEFAFDPALLAFDAAASTVTLDGATLSLAAALTAFAGQGQLVVNYGVDAAGMAFGDYSYIADTSFPIDHQLVFAPAFRVAASAPIGTQAAVTFGGELADVNAQTGDAFGVTTNVFVTAVPEPAAGALLACGLAVLGARARRLAKKNESSVGG